VSGQADQGEWPTISASLPTLPTGTGIVWLPARNVLETAAFPPKVTFDSSRTPKRGERVEQKALKPLDLDKLKGRLASIEEEAKANDPKALKAEVVRLTRELAKAEKAKAAPAPKPEIVHANADELANEREAGHLQGFAEGLSAAAEAIAALGGKPTKRKALPFAVDHPHAVPPPALPREPSPTGGPQQRILNSLAWWKALGHDQVSNEQVSFIADYSPKSTSYQKARGALKTLGLVDYPSAGQMTLTASGEEQAEAPASPPSGEELRRRVLGKMGGPAQRILSVLIDCYPVDLPNDECAAKSGYSPLSTSYQKARGSLRTLSTITYPIAGRLRAADWLFP
jgi:hypothetical protein